ncbi:unnamed protein product [Cylicocyclus nassatus]|uniref:Uncharacterized protein n=1 Tax=Cylicocyclus nassatus TaxID=53992 RepID=A0AA36GRZ0_CYLNA|nr:unnamed protein product [Cylicocyclus nassatus]
MWYNFSDQGSSRSKLRTSK